MARTRRSNAIEDVTDGSVDGSEQPGAGTRPRAVKRALRQLLINAEPALRGEQTTKEESVEPLTYHWRGAVYAVDENTPQEWLDAQPVRYLKRKREAETEQSKDEVEPESEEEIIQPVKRKRGRPRKHPLPEQQNIQSTLGKRKRPTPVRPEPSTPRKRGRPPGRRSHVRYEEQSDTDEESEDEKPTQSSHTRSRGNVPSTRHQPTSTMTARETARRKGLCVEPIPWADMMNAKIARNLAAFCAVQSQLRKIQEEYKRTSDLYERIQERDRALDEQLNGDEVRNDSAHECAIQSVKNAPLTPEADQSDEHNDSSMQDSVVFHNDGSEDAKQSQVDDEVTQKATQPLNCLALYANQRVNFGPWDPLPKHDDQGNTLQWSLRSAKDMQGRAEYHIYTGKLHDREKHVHQSERIRRELAIIQQWEVIEGGKALVHDADRAKVPRRASQDDSASGTGASPRRLPVDSVSP